MSRSRPPGNSFGEEPTEGSSAPEHRTDRHSGTSSTEQPDQEHSGLVNALGILTIVFGVLKLLCGLGLSSGVAFYSSELKALLKEFRWATSSGFYLHRVRRGRFFVHSAGLRRTNASGYGNGGELRGFNELQPQFAMSLKQVFMRCFLYVWPAPSRSRFC